MREGREEVEGVEVRGMSLKLGKGRLGGWMRGKSVWV